MLTHGQAAYREGLGSRTHAQDTATNTLFQLFGIYSFFFNGHRQAGTVRLPRLWLSSQRGDLLSLPTCVPVALHPRSRG